MIIDNLTVHFSNYRCFKDKAVFGPIKRANVIIGKNNSGKSALIDVFSKLCASASSNAANNDLGFEIDRALSSDEIDRFTKNQGLVTSRRKKTNPRFLHDVRIHYKKDSNRYIYQSCNDAQVYNLLGMDNIQGNEFSRYHILRLNAERDVTPEPLITEKFEWQIPSKGSGITQMIQAILNHKQLNQNIVEDEVLQAFNQITNPDVTIQRIQTKYDDKESTWEIYLYEEGKGLVPLSQSGSGLKTIMAVLVFIHVLPKLLKNFQVQNVIYVFEELENNLHPSVQRTLYDYIEEKSKEMKFSYFISTHSTVALDYYYRIEDASIFQVIMGDRGSTVKTISNNTDVSRLIDDLGQKASDLLQSNCIIWVEGPSDRIYINRWIELYSDGQVLENKHYTVMFYGGKLLSHITFSANLEEAELESYIKMFHINRHSIVVIDSDKRSKSSKINETKARIKKEFDGTENLCWITQGREIENYVNPKAFVVVGLIDDETKLNDQLVDVLEVLAKTSPKQKDKTSILKVALARQVSPILEKSDLDILDLSKRIEGIVQKIRQWNEK